MLLSERKCYKIFHSDFYVLKKTQSRETTREKNIFLVNMKKSSAIWGDHFYCPYPMKTLFSFCSNTVIGGYMSVTLSSPLTFSAAYKYLFSCISFQHSNSIGLLTFCSFKIRGLRRSIWPPNTNSCFQVKFQVYTQNSVAGVFSSFFFFRKRKIFLSTLNFKKIVRCL